MWKTISFSYQCKLEKFKDPWEQGIKKNYFLVSLFLEWRAILIYVIYIGTFLPIFVVRITTFQPLCCPALFKCMSIWVIFREFSTNCCYFEGALSYSNNALGSQTMPNPRDEGFVRNTAAVFKCSSYMNLLFFYLKVIFF